VPRGVVPIRGSDSEHTAWKEAAALEGKRFSAWARQVLNEESDRLKAVAADKTDQKAERQNVLRTISPQGHGKRTYESDWR
jgi:hypothetical protein